MKYNYLILTIGVFGFLNAQSQSDSSKITLDEFEVTTNRVGEQSPVAHENISKEDMKQTIMEWICQYYLIKQLLL